jgi:hypothetical protein
MRTWLAILLTMMVAMGCGGPVPDNGSIRSDADIKPALARVSTEKGIGHAEAKVLTEAYFAVFLSGCGFAEGPTLKQGVWRSKARVGYAGDPLPGAIEVDAKTGAIGYQRCPSFRNVEEFREAVERADREPASGPPCWLREKPTG